MSDVRSGASRRLRYRSAAAKLLSAGLVGLAAYFGLGALAKASPSAKSLASMEYDGAAVFSGGLNHISKIAFGDVRGVPNGYFDYCSRSPQGCRSRAGAKAATRDGSVFLTGAAMAQLGSVNAAVNAAIHPAYRNDWTPGQPSGDCKDFAMTKRQRLIASGWPTSALPLAVVRTSWGEQHLILVARTSQGDFLLDNLTSEIRPWASAPYFWEKIQSTTEALAWRQVRSSN